MMKKMKCLGLSFSIAALLLLNGCVKQNGKKIDSLNSKAAAAMVKDYFTKHEIKVDRHDAQILKIIPWEKGYLVLGAYVDKEPELVLLHIEQSKGSWNIVKEAKGLYYSGAFSINSVELEHGTIYFGKARDKEELGWSEVILRLDDGAVYNESIEDNEKSFIIITQSKADVVDLMFKNKNDSPFNFIKDFVNYEEGIYEAIWEY